MNLDYLLFRRYIIEKQLNHSAMSRVFLARERSDGRQLVLKCIFRSDGGEEDWEMRRRQLKNEALLLKDCSHSACPAFLDWQESGNVCVLAEEYIPGIDLETFLSRYGVQPEQMAVSWSIRIADVLLYLHHRNPPVIYRDLKPSNLILLPTGGIRIIDFGIARQYREECHVDTVSLGSPGYAAPEQHGYGQTDRRSDIYALGMVLYRICTGQDPGNPSFHYDPSLCSKMGCSPGFCYIVDRCLQFSPEQRYPSVEELLYDLQHISRITDRLRRKDRWKNRMRLALILCGMGVFVSLSLCNDQKDAQVSRQYQYMLHASGTSEEKRTACMSAIDLKPDRKEGYFRLLELLRQQGSFGDEERDQLFTCVQDYEEAGGADSEFFYEAGTVCFYYYNGSDQSFRSRVILAEDLFRKGAALEESHGNCHFFLEFCEFYTTYGINGTGGGSGRDSLGEVDDIQQADYGEFLETCEQLPVWEEDEDSAQGNYVRLLLCEEIAAILNRDIPDMTEAGVASARILDLTEQLKENVTDIEDGDSRTREVKQETLVLCQQCEEALKSE